MATLSGGDKFAAVLAQMSERVSRRATLRVGFLEGATYPAGNTARIRAGYRQRKQNNKAGPMKGAQGGLSVAMIAAINEFGAPSRGQPPRPFFRNMIRDKGPTWGKSLAVVLKTSNYDATKALRLMGEGIKGQLQKSIIDLVSPPLKDSTVAHKGFSKPLIDTGHLLASVDYDVK